MARVSFAEPVRWEGGSPPDPIPLAPPTSAWPNPAQLQQIWDASDHPTHGDYLERYLERVETHAPTAKSSSDLPSVAGPKAPRLRVRITSVEYESTGGVYPTYPPSPIGVVGPNWLEGEGERVARTPAVAEDEKRRVIPEGSQGAYTLWTRPTLACPMRRREGWVPSC